MFAMGEIIAHDEAFFVYPIDSTGDLHAWANNSISAIGWLIKNITPFIGARMAVIIADQVLRIGKNGTAAGHVFLDRKSTRLNSSHVSISYAVFCLKKKNKKQE